jgi:hypothetical protein
LLSKDIIFTQNLSNKYYRTHKKSIGLIKIR